MAARQKPVFELGYALSFFGFAWILYQRHHGQEIPVDLLSFQALLSLVILFTLAASYFATARLGAHALMQQHGRDRDTLTRMAERMDDFANGRDPDSMSLALYAGMAMAAGFVLPAMLAVFAHVHFCRKAPEIAVALRARVADLNGPSPR